LAGRLFTVAACYAAKSCDVSGFAGTMWLQTIFGMREGGAAVLVYLHLFAGYHLSTTTKHNIKNQRIYFRERSCKFLILSYSIVRQK